MSSLTLSFLRNENPGKSDKEIAQKLLDESNTMIAIVRYKNSEDASDYTNIGTCDSLEAIDGYFSSPYCFDTEMLVDQRASQSAGGTARMITNEEIVNAMCMQCGENFGDERSLTLNAGNNFYTCPYCEDEFYCESCLPELPLSDGTHGRALCPICDQELIRALPGAFLKSGKPNLECPSMASEKDASPCSNNEDSNKSLPKESSLMQKIKNFFQNP